MAITKTCDYAWAAGFFDGEGCIRVNETTNRYGYRYRGLVIQITQMDREVLDRFNKATGGMCKIYQKGSGGFVLCCGRQDDVHAIMEVLWPWLGTIKREQANTAIERATGRVLEAV